MQIELGFGAEKQSQFEAKMPVTSRQISSQLNMQIRNVYMQGVIE